MKLRMLCAVTSVALMAGTVAAQGLRPPGQGGNRPTTPSGQEVEVGQYAPEIRVGRWYPSQNFSIPENTAYVMSFLSTSGTDSVRTIELLSELNEKYSDVVFAAVMQEDDNTVIEDFVSTLGPRLTFNLALDFRNRVWRNWMGGAGRSTVPTSFIVDENNRIAFIGDPLSDKFAETLDLVASGRFDPELIESAKPFLDQIERCVRLREWRTCEQYLDQVIEMNPAVFYDVALRKFRILLMDKGDVDAAIEYAQSRAPDGFLGMYQTDAMTLSMLARNILSQKTWLDKAPERLRELALQLAEQAYRASPEARSVATLALAKYHHGEVDEAITLQRKAYLMADPEDKDEIKRQLREYQEGARLMRGR